MPLIKGGLTGRVSTPYYESAMNLCGDVKELLCAWVWRPEERAELEFNCSGKHIGGVALWARRERTGRGHSLRAGEDLAPTTRKPDVFYPGREGACEGEKKSG